MANQIKPTMKNSPAIHKGKNRFNKPAEVYAPPHTMSDKIIDGQEAMENGVYATEKSAKDANLKDPIPNGVSFGTTKEPKSEGLVMRGHGAAIKGIKYRGPMA